MSEKINKAMQALNDYDYHSGKSAQEALILINTMEDIFQLPLSQARLYELVRELVRQYENMYGCETPITEEISILIGECL